jgi:hypothetical protein
MSEERISQEEALLRAYVGEETGAEVEVVPKKRPDGYWQKWENLERELQRVIGIIGHFPTGPEMKEYGIASAAISIARFGGIDKVKERIGYSAQEGETRGPNYWSNWDPVRKGLEKMLSERSDFKGDFPTASWMRENGYGDLVAAAFNHFDGLNAVRVRLGRERATANDRSVYATDEGLRKGLEELWEKHPEKKGTLPPDNWLRAHGYTEISSSVGRFHGGFVNARKKLKIESSGKKKHVYRRGSLKDWGKFRKAVRDLMKKHPEFEGRLPSQDWLMDNGYHSIPNAAREHHDGMNAVRKRLGQEVLKRETGYWDDPEAVNAEIREMLIDNPELGGKFPSTYWMDGNGYRYLYAAMRNYHGGVGKFQKTFGRVATTRPGRYWKSWRNVVHEMRTVLEDNPLLEGIVPSSWWMSGNGYSYLAAAIYKNHKPFAQARKRLQKKFDRRKKNG